MPAIIDEIISKTRRNQEGQKPTGMLNPMQALMDLVKGSIFDGDVALLGDLAKAIMDGDLSQFLADNSIGTDDYAAVKKVIDAVSGDTGGKTGDIAAALAMVGGGALAGGPVGAAGAIGSIAASNVKDKLGILGGGDDAKAERISPEQANALKEQLGQYQKSVSAKSGGLVGDSYTTDKEWSPYALYTNLKTQAATNNGGTLPDGFPNFETWVRINGLTANQVVPKGAPITTGQYKTWKGRPGETLRSIAESQGIDLAELMKANPELTDPDALVSGAPVLLPAPKAFINGGRGEQTMPTDTTDPNANPTDPNNPNNPATADPGGVGDANNTDPLERALMKQGMGQFIYETLRNKGWSADSINMVGDRAPQLDALSLFTQMSDPLFGELGYTGSALGSANSVLDNYLKDGKFNYGDIDSLLQTVAGGQIDNTKMDFTPEELMTLLGNLNYGRYSPSAQRVLFGDRASQDMQYKWNQQYNQNPNQSVLEFILSQMGA